MTRIYEYLRWFHRSIKIWFARGQVYLAANASIARRSTSYDAAVTKLHAIIRDWVWKSRGTVPRRSSSLPLSPCRPRFQLSVDQFRGWRVLNWYNANERRYRAVPSSGSDVSASANQRFHPRNLSPVRFSSRPGCECPPISRTKRSIIGNSLCGRRSSMLHLSVGIPFVVSDPRSGILSIPHNTVTGRRGSEKCAVIVPRARIFKPIIHHVFIFPSHFPNFGIEISLEKELHCVRRYIHYYEIYWGYTLVPSDFLESLRQTALFLFVSSLPRPFVMELGPVWIKPQVSVETLMTIVDCVDFPFHGTIRLIITITIPHFSARETRARLIRDYNGSDRACANVHRIITRE